MWQQLKYIWGNKQQHGTSPKPISWNLQLWVQVGVGVNITSESMTLSSYCSLPIAIHLCLFIFYSSYTKWVLTLKTDLCLETTSWEILGKKALEKETMESPWATAQASGPILHRHQQDKGAIRGPAQGWKRYFVKENRESHRACQSFIIAHCNCYDVGFLNGCSHNLLAHCLFWVCEP